MARNFTNAATTTARWDVGPSASDVMGPMTAALILKWAASSGNSTLLALQNPVDHTEWSWGSGSGDAMFAYPGDGVTFASTAIALAAADGWVLVAVTRPAGAAVPTFHKYVYSTGVWTQTASTTSMNNSTATGAGGTLTIGHDDGNFIPNMDVAKAGYVDRELTLAEVKRLPTVDWSQVFTRWNPEFPPGQPSARSVPRDQSRSLSALTTNTGVVLSTTEPPGTRYSRYRRRR